MREGLGQQAHSDPGTRYRWQGINRFDKKAGRPSKVKYITRMEGKGEISVGSSSTNPVVEYRSSCGVMQHERRREGAYRSVEARDESTEGTKRAQKCQDPEDSRTESRKEICFQNGMAYTLIN